jgi:TonB family protein
MSDDEDPLVGIDLHKWKIPPAPDQRAAILERALAPAKPQRRTLVWVLAAMIGANVVLATVLVVSASRSPESIEVARPGAGPPSDEIQKLIDELHRIEAERRDLEKQLAMLDERRTLTERLRDVQNQLDECQAHTTGPHPHPQPQPDPSPQPVPTVVDPFEPPAHDSCDEVSCVLQNYEGTCCNKYKKAPVTVEAADSISRQMIVTAIDAMKPRISACGDQSAVKGKVRVHVRVSNAGSVTSVTVAETPDPALGNCVAAVMQRLHFPMTRNGGSFTYPFVF